MAVQMYDDPRLISGGTGYIGTRLIRLLLDRGHVVAALTRPSSADKLPPGAKPIIGDALNASTFPSGATDCDTFVHMIGVAHPSPAKADEFRSIDLVSVKASVAAAREAGVKNFVYISVAQPAPVMQAYIAVRAKCEQMIADAGFNATFVRPWYVLGPGHRWPVFLIPMYWLFEKIPGKRETALRLGLVTIREMVEALAWAVENPPTKARELFLFPRFGQRPGLFAQSREAALQLVPLGFGKHQPEPQAEPRERSRQIAARIHQPFDRFIGFGGIYGIPVELLHQVLLGPINFHAHIQQMRPELLHHFADLPPLRHREVQIARDLRPVPPHVDSARQLREQAAARE
jgi:uncharacterized protein YbjT (DUF2867 family)